MIDIRLLGGLAIVLVIFLAAGNISDFVSEFWQKQLYGPEYCFENLDQSAVAVASQGVEVKYTKTEGDQLCFRTKDFSLVEKINQQIQDREKEVELAKIASKERFWNETFPVLFVVGLIAVIIILIILWLMSGRDYYRL